MDRKAQPKELANLTQVEEMLIARVSPILQVTHATGGQLKYRGHTISFPQNIESVAKKLPHLVKDLPIIIVHRKDQRGTHYNFKVNRDRVYVALSYNIMHDKLYLDVIVDENALDDISPNIDQNIFNELQIVHMEFDSEKKDIIFVGPLVEMDERNIIEYTTSMASKPPNIQREMELICTWVINPNIDPTLMMDWPSIGASPINEYTTPSFLYMTFPSLFPNGKCDFLEPRLRKAHLHEYVKHLI